MTNDPDACRSLDRFVEAQEPVFDAVCAELAGGRKRTHWMWFVFPQHEGLGGSAMAKFYGLSSADEALAYWQHPVLGPRLKTCTQLVLAHGKKSAHDIFGSPDDLKFRSCLTLFEAVAPEEPVFRRALDQFFDGKADGRTKELVGAGC